MHFVIQTLLLPKPDDYAQSILRKKCPYSEFFWSVFFRILTEYGEILSISLYSVRMGKMRTRKSPNTDSVMFSAVQCHQSNEQPYLVAVCYKESMLVFQTCESKATNKFCNFISVFSIINYVKIINILELKRLLF